MADAEIPTDRLVPAGEAIEALARAHDIRGTYANWQVCLDAAHETILARLVAGHLVAYAEVCEIDTDDKVPDGDLPSIWDYYKSSKQSKTPKEFWHHYNTAAEQWRKYDLVASDFSFRIPGLEWESFHWRSGGAYSVSFDSRGLPKAALPVAENQAGDGSHGKRSGNGGRKPSNWWPDFAEELAMWCLRNDPPDGQGTEGQSELIDAVLAGLQSRGIEEPGRETVRPVINAVLTRYRTSRN